MTGRLLARSTVYIGATSPYCKGMGVLPAT